MGVIDQLIARGPHLAGTMFNTTCPHNVSCQATFGMFQRSKAPRFAGNNLTREIKGGSKAG